MRWRSTPTRPVSKRAEMTKATVTPFLMFEGQAEAAMTFYVSLFDDGKVIDIVRYGSEGPGVEG